MVKMTGNHPDHKRLKIAKNHKNIKSVKSDRIKTFEPFSHHNHNLMIKRSINSVYKLGINQSNIGVKSPLICPINYLRTCLVFTI